MKKIITFVIVTILGISLNACQNNNIYKIGASPIPHKEILEHVQPLLKDQGYEFEIVEFTDYILPNTALESGEIIGNFFQHIPYLNAQIDEYGYDFVSVGGVHVEPIGLYTKKYNSLDELPDTLEIIISNSPTDRPRLLGVLEENNIITLNDSITDIQITNASLNNLTSLFSSNYDITFKEVATELLYTNYNLQEGDIVLINGNYALDNGLNPIDDSLALEGSASQYVNILVTQQENSDNEFILALIAILQSADVQTWILENYGGAVIPAAN